MRRKYCCDACGSHEVELIPYGNHRGNANWHFVKHLVARIVLPLVRLFSNILTPFEYTNLFSPLYQIGYCRSCGYGKYMRKITAQELNHYYQSRYWNNVREAVVGKQEVFPDERAISQYRFLKPFLPQSSLKILDVGAGPAKTTRYIRLKHPYPTQIDVVEPGSNYRKLYKREKISIVAKSFPSKLDNKYDYIHTSHYLEHVLDVDKVLVELTKLMKKHALLYIEVPNCGKEYFMGNSRDIPHIHFFTKKSALVTRIWAGLELVKSEYYKKSLRLLLTS